MATANVQIKKILVGRGNTAVSSAYSGVRGEITMDTDLKTLRIHDGVQTGGYVLANRDYVAAYVANAALGNVDTSTFATTSNLNAFGANLGAFQTYANATFTGGGAGTYSNANVVSYLSHVAGNVIPSANGVYSLGDSTHWWKSMYIAGQTIYIGGVALSMGANGLTSDRGFDLASANATSLTSGNIISGNVVSDGFFFANGVSLLSTVAGTYSNANVVAYMGSFYTYANATYSTVANAGTQATQINSINANVTAANGAITTANTGMKSYVDAVTTAWTANAAAAHSEIDGLRANIIASNATVASNYSTFLSNAAAAHSEIDALRSNIIASNSAVVSNYNTLLANAATQATDINALRANITAANAAIAGLQTGSGFATTAQLAANILATNSAIVTANTGMKSYVDAVTTAWTANAATQSAAIATLQTQTYSNVNAAAYIDGGIMITAGPINFTASPPAYSSPGIQWINGFQSRMYGNAEVATYMPAYSGNLTPGNLTVSTNAVVLGNLRVQGTQTTVNAATLTVNDLWVTVANGAVQASDANGAGLRIAGALANIAYSSTSDSFEFNKAISVGNIKNGSYTWTFGADGSTTLPNGAKLNNGTTGQFATDNQATASLDLRDTQGAGFYTNGDGFTLRSNGMHNWIFGTDASLTLPGTLKATRFNNVSGGQTITIDPDNSNTAFIKIAGFDDGGERVEISNQFPNSNGLYFYTETGTFRMYQTQLGFPDGTWQTTAYTGPTYGNTQVAEYLPVFGGNISADIVRPAQTAYGINENPTSNNVFWSYVQQDTNTAQVAVGWTANVVGGGSYTVTNVEINGPFRYITLSNVALTLAYRAGINFSTPAQAWHFGTDGNITLPTNWNFMACPAVQTTGITFGDGTFQTTAAAPFDRLQAAGNQVVLNGAELVIPNTIRTQTGQYYLAQSDTSIEVSWANSVQNINTNVSSAYFADATGVSFGTYRTDGTGNWVPKLVSMDFAGNLTVPGSIIPTVDNVYDLGTPALRFRHLYVGPGTVYVGNAAIKTTATGNLILPGLTRAVASSAYAEEVEDTGDQTHSFTTTPTVIDNARYELLTGGQVSSFTPAEYSVDALDGEGFIDGISIDRVNRGVGYAGDVAALAEQGMWATEAADPINNFNISDWIQIPFRVRSRAGESEFEFNTGGSGTGDITFDGHTISSTDNVVNIDASEYAQIQSNNNYIWVDNSGAHIEVSNGGTFEFERVGGITRLRLPEGGDIVDFLGTSVLGGGSGGVVERTVNYPKGETGDTAGTLALTPDDNLYICIADYAAVQAVEYDQEPASENYDKAQSINGTDMVFTLAVGEDPTLDTLMQYLTLPSTDWQISGNATDGYVRDCVAEQRDAGHWTFTWQYVSGQDNTSFSQGDQFSLYYTAQPDIWQLVNTGGTGLGNLNITDSTIESDNTNNFVNMDVDNAGWMRLGTYNSDKLQLITDYAGANNAWEFGANATLVLPVGGDILDSNGASVLGSGGLTTITGEQVGYILTLTQDANSATPSIDSNSIDYIPTATLEANDWIGVDSSAPETAPTVTFANGETRQIDGWNTDSFGTSGFLSLETGITISGANAWPMVITSYNYSAGNVTPGKAIVVNSNTWKFDNAGNLTFPDNTVQTTAYTGRTVAQDNLMLDGGAAATVYEVTVDYAEGGFSSTRYGVNTPSFNGGSAELTEDIYYTLDGGGA